MSLDQDFFQDNI